jgi:hypothetical protein
MLRFAKGEDYEVWFSRLDRPFPFSSPFGGRDFALMLVVADPSVTADERWAVSTDIVRRGCRYVVCTGHDCALWDDSIDWAELQATDFSPPDDRFIMTTWHEDDSLEDVAEWFRWRTVFDDFVPTRFLVVLLGGDAATEGHVRSAIERVFR